MPRKKLSLKEILLRTQAFDNMRTILPPATAAKLLELPLRLLNKSLVVLRAHNYSVNAVLELANQLQTNDINILYAHVTAQQPHQPLEETAILLRNQLIEAFANPTNPHRAQQVAYLLYNFLTRQLTPQWLLTAANELKNRIKFLPCAACKAEPLPEGQHIAQYKGVPIPLCPSCISVELNDSHAANYLPHLWTITCELEHALERMMSE
jgi:hypothetical protein